MGLVADATHFQITLNEDPGGPATGLGEIAEMYTDNRGLLHLHGGLTPWISDGTPHQWTAPAGEFTNYDRGVSAMNVPDMPDPGAGSITYFWPNQQSSRLMFYHDHAFGITRLNVYAGEAAGYLVTDSVEQDLTDRGIIPAAHIPLILEDKSFIDPTTILDTDPTWPLQLDDELSNLWYPHVYMPYQNPNTFDAINLLGRWDYGPWIWPPFPVEHEPIQVPDGSLGFGFDGLPDELPNLPDVSEVMESFFDTPLVNGTVYPYLDVQPQTYRFSILNAANDRFFNLQLVQADPTDFQVTDANGDTWGTEVPMVPFCSDQPNGDPWPEDWPTPDLRDGGIPDPNKLGPDIIQIGNEGGFLPAPVVFNNVPIGFDRDSLSVTVGNVLEHNVFLGAAERADIIVDFSQFAGQTLILYNDTPNPLMTPIGSLDDGTQLWKITFAVEVSGMSQDGTVVASVAAGAAQDLLGNLSEASTSTDNSVFFYTGPLPQLLPYSQDFSSGIVGKAGRPGADEGWEYYSTGKGRVTVTRKGRLRLDKRPTTTVQYALNEATLHVNLTGQSNVELTLDHRRYLDVADIYAGTQFTGHVNADLIAVSVDGTNWVKVTDLDATFFGQVFALDAPVQQAALAAGSADLSNVRIKFQQYGFEKWSSGGRKLDNILVASNPPAPLTAARSRTPATPKGILDQAALEPVVTAALADWAGTGLAPNLMDRLQSVQFVITDLPGATLALANQDTIYVDLDAAGNGWFVDPTPAKNEEFRPRKRDGQLRAVDRQIRRRIDLKTAVLHELGHVAGLSDMDAIAGDLMNSRLPTGIRRSVWDASVDKVFESGSLWVRRNGR